MMKRYLPSIEALTGSDDSRLTAELKLSEVREQLALACLLIGEIDRLVPLSASEQSSEQPSPDRPDRHAVLKELAALGGRIVEIASVLSRRSITP